LAQHGGFAAFRHRDFTAFYFGRTFNALAGQMIDVAIGWTVYKLTGSAFALGLVGLCVFLPNILFALPAGQVADMFPRKYTMIACTTLSTTAAVGLFIAALTGTIAVPLLYALIVVFGIARAFSGAASQALIPSLVPKEHIANAIALASSAYQTATIAGPAVGGLLYAFGPEVVFGATQGNRLKLSSSDEACEIFVVPSGGFASQADGILSRRLAVKVVGDVSASREIGRGVGGSDATFVVAEDHVHDPVQRVLDGPVRADHRTDSLRLERERGDIKARFVCYLARDFALAFHHDDALQARPFMSLL
jgi:hypothetical protein